MNLKLTQVGADFKDLKLIDRLNIEAFPEEERFDTADMINFAEKGGLSIYAVYDDSLFIGFFTCMQSVEIFYICFFAIQKEFRSKGYGSAIFKFIQETYSDRQVVVDIEFPDEKAENNAQRLSRIKFYNRIGMFTTKYRLNYSGLSFEIYCNKPFDKTAFENMLEPYRNKKFQPFITSVE